MPSRLLLRPPALHDQDAFLNKALASRKLHHPWVSAPSTAAQFRSWLERMQAPGHHAFVLCDRDTGELLGVFNLSNVVMGLFCSGYLGYYAFEGTQGRGLMREGLRLLLRHAFRELKLHRLEANIQPGNLASKALVSACGFEQEGYSPKYLKIKGRWCDHERWAIIAPGR